VFICPPIEGNTSPPTCHLPEADRKAVKEADRQYPRFLIRYRTSYELLLPFSPFTRILKYHANVIMKRKNIIETILVIYPLTAFILLVGTSGWYCRDGR
jgi:hypothetical protein